MMQNPALRPSSTLRCKEGSDAEGTYGARSRVEAGRLGKGVKRGNWWNGGRQHLPERVFVASSAPCRFDVSELPATGNPACRFWQLSRWRIRITLSTDLLPPLRPRQ